MNQQYLNEVMDRLSIEALWFIAALLVAGLIASLFTKSPAKKSSSKGSMACPMCGKGGDS